MPASASDLIADPVDDRDPEVGLHRADMAGLELVEASEDMDGGFLDQVARVAVAARVHRQPPMGPPLQLREAALEERFECQAVAAAGRDEQLDGRLVADESRAQLFRTAEWR